MKRSTLAALAAALLLAAASAAAQEVVDGGATGEVAALDAAAGGVAAQGTSCWWRPTREMHYNYQLSTVFNMATDWSPHIKVYTIDGWDTPASTVAAIKAAGGFPICYFSAGTFENWRPDKASFKPTDKGWALGAWPGEWWLNIKSENVKTIMAARMQMCKDKGFVGIDPDNVDGYTNANGLSLTAADQLAYNTWLARTAHSLGLGIGLKNDLDQIPQLAPLFDWFINEQCSQYDECNLYSNAAALEKPIFQLTYDAPNFNKICPQQATWGVRTLLKDQNLNSTWHECPGSDPYPPAGAPNGTASCADFGGSVSAANATGDWWRPRASQRMQFQYQIGANFNPATDLIPSVKVYLIDGFMTSAATVAAIKAAGGFPICYFSAGSYENWRPDKGEFLASDKGLPLAGWPGEWWLDIRSANVRRIMTARMQMCKDKGFVGIDPDNVDGYDNKNGLGLTAADALDYLSFLSNTSHALGLACGLKNDVGQIAQVATWFDYFVNEQCAHYRECSSYQPAVALDKPIWNVEYSAADYNKACRCQDILGITTNLKKLILNQWRRECTDALRRGVCALSKSVASTRRRHKDRAKRPPE